MHFGLQSMAFAPDTTVKRSLAHTRVFSFCQVNGKINAAAVREKYRSTYNLIVLLNPDYFCKSIMQFVAQQDYWSFQTNSVQEKTSTTLTGGEGPVYFHTYFHVSNESSLTKHTAY